MTTAKRWLAESLCGTALSPTQMPEELLHIPKWRSVVFHGRTGTQVKVTAAETESSNTTTLANLMKYRDEKCDHLL